MDLQDTEHNNGKSSVTSQCMQVATFTAEKVFDTRQNVLIMSYYVIFNSNWYNDFMLKIGFGIFIYTRSEMYA